MPKQIDGRTDEERMYAFRDWQRSVTKTEPRWPCDICGYSHPYETAHIKQVLTHEPCGDSCSYVGKADE